LRVWVGSSNPVKQAAAREAFGRYFDDLVVEGIAVPSGVPEQPVGEQTFTGAINRALRLRKRAGDSSADVGFCVGIEGGIVQTSGRWFALGCMCVIDASGRQGWGTSPQFQLPESVVDELLAGCELGAVIDRLTGQRDTKRRGGAIGHFTRGVMGRRDLYVGGLIAALVPLLNIEAYFGGGADSGEQCASD